MNGEDRQYTIFIYICWAVENLDGHLVKVLEIQFKFVIYLMKIIFISFFLIGLIFPNVPETLKGQRNKSKIATHYRFIKIEKAYVSYVFGPKGDRVVSINFDKKNNLISKANYKINNKKNVFLIQDDCLNIDCHHFIHK